MSEFHEVECPDGIGLSCGVWEMPVPLKKRIASHLCGGRVLAGRFHFTINIQMLLFVVQESMWEVELFSFFSLLSNLFLFYLS